ncbi:MAG: hypothetical protein EBZ48_03480 [Proteobacteria bacterium]|nr:hypothetical protein [Pseudomonadota bacterium]
MNTLDPNKEECWNNARRLAHLLFPIPPSISQAIQLLWNDHLLARETGVPKVRMVTLNALRLVERSGKLRAPIYFAATSLYPEKLASTTEDDVGKALVDILGPGLFASLLALVYLHRRLNKICVNEQWDTLSKEFVLNMELGFIVGSSLNKVSPADGTLVGGIRFAALAAFLLATPEQFLRYRNLKKRQFDIPHEHSLWGCDHSQIAAFVLKEFGFSNDLMRISHALRKEADSVHALTPELQPWRSTLRCIDTIKSNGELTECSKDLSPTEAELSTLSERTSALFTGTSSFAWMFKKSSAVDEEFG